LLGAVGLAIGYVVLRDDPVAEPDVRPPGANDPLNPAVLIAAGRLSGRDDPAPDTVKRGPRSTLGEGLGNLTVGAFWMQQHEVTNQEYRRFDPGHNVAAGEELHPVVNVTFEQSLEYAISLGGRLPTEAEWEFAARGPEGRWYPWGDDSPTCDRAYFRGCGPRGGVPVMTYPDGATPEGIYDMAGNVWEWVTPDWFDTGRTPINDEVRRMRGGSFDDDPFFLRASNRSNGFRAGHRYFSVGFRVAWPVGGDR
jgi:formylglycine-generating enzyme required for sulfatase activity